MARDILRLVKEIKDGTIDVNAIDEFTRKTLVFALLEEMTFSHGQIAELMGVSRGRISALNKKRKESYINLLTEVDLKSLVGNHMQVAEHCKTQMAKNGDWHGVWKVHRELLQDLQSLGYLRKVPDELKISLEDRATQWEQMFGIQVTKGNIVANTN